jgi:excisionase family DNA binding protein
MAIQPIKKDYSMDTTQELITIQELSERLKLHVVTTRGLHRRGVIPSIKIGHRTLRFDYAEVVQALRDANDPSVTDSE